MQALVYISGIRSIVASASVNELYATLRSAERVVFCSITSVIVVHSADSVTYFEKLTEEQYMDIYTMATEPYKPFGEIPNPHFWAENAQFVCDKFAEYFAGVRTAPKKSKRNVK